MSLRRLVQIRRSTTRRAAESPPYLLDSGGAREGSKREAGSENSLDAVGAGF